MRLALLILLAALIGGAAEAKAPPATGLLDPRERTAVMSAFPPELTALKAALVHPHDYASGGVVFTTGLLEGQPVVLFLSGQSMVNAAMTTQLALDRFRVTRIVFSGIAGGVDPALDVGDVVVADRWSEYLETVMAREVSPGHFTPPDYEPTSLAPFGMIFPKPVQVTRDPGKLERLAAFVVDAELLAAARAVSGKVELKRCAGARCLGKAPRMVVGGTGVSGASFVDNAAFRAWAFSTFHAEVIDMESAAVAHVAYANRTPFIAFRSLSDLAGGDPGQNQAMTFFQFASDNSATVVRAFLQALPRR